MSEETLNTKDVEHGKRISEAGEAIVDNLLDRGFTEFAEINAVLTTALGCVMAVFGIEPNPRYYELVNDIIKKSSEFYTSDMAMRERNKSTTH